MVPSKQYMSMWVLLLLFFIRVVCNRMFNGPFPVTLEFMSQGTKMTQRCLVSHTVKTIPDI